MRSYVYFILDEVAKAVKIGYSNNPLARLSDLQVGNPRRLSIMNMIEFASAREAELHETQLHKQYEEHAIGGEWFERQPQFENESYVRTVTKSKRDPLVIHSLYGEETKFDLKDRPRCYFYPEQNVHIRQSFEKSSGIRLPFRTMSWPTNGRTELLPYSMATDRVFISAKKHMENMIQKRFEKRNEPSLKLDEFVHA